MRGDRARPADEAVAAAALHGAEDALEAWARRVAGDPAAWDAGCALFDAVNDARVAYRDQLINGVCRPVGRYLLQTGRGEAWRIVYLLLLAEHDIWTGWQDGYALGDEVAFVEGVGGWAAAAPADRAAGGVQGEEG